MGGGATIPRSVLAAAVVAAAHFVTELDVTAAAKRRQCAPEHQHPPEPSLSLFHSLALPLRRAWHAHELFLRSARTILRAAHPVDADGPSAGTGHEMPHRAGALL